MKQVGMFVSDIAKTLSEETGDRITQISLWRLFNNKNEEPLTISQRLKSLKDRLETQKEELNRLQNEIEDLAAEKKSLNEEIDGTLSRSKEKEE
ncbi:MAG: hypothetical protein PHY47_21805 [Lachnospiraceae bacterium]|nr:hypothetical protein [Lachnospiraceae bacterium]MDD4249022.1 hypothetical protein [Methanosarcina sp.]